MTEVLMTPDEVAAVLKVTRRWVYDASRNGTLPATKVGKFLRFRQADVEEFVREGQVER